MDKTAEQTRCVNETPTGPSPAAQDDSPEIVRLGSVVELTLDDSGREHSDGPTWNQKARERFTS